MNPSGSRSVGGIPAVAMAILLFGSRPALSQMTYDWQKADRQVVRLPASSFPQLPSPIRRELDRRGCSVPQAYEAKRPGNVIKGSFMQAAEMDWAVLCSIHRVSSILVFRNASADQVVELAREADIHKLQSEGDGAAGYSREISPVGSEFVMQHYKAYAGPKPPPLDHHGIDDAFVGKASVVHYFYRGKWLRLTGTD